VLLQGNAAGDKSKEGRALQAMKASQQWSQIMAVTNQATVVGATVVLH
jgi:hypothetical protein